MSRSSSSSRGRARAVSYMYKKVSLPGDEKSVSMALQPMDMYLECLFQPRSKLGHYHACLLLGRDVGLARL